MIKFNRYTSINHPGFTLVELLLYMALFTGFLTILSGLFISTLETQSEATATSRLTQDSWYLSSRFQYDLYRTTAITTPATIGEETTTLTLTNDVSPVTYSLVGNQLMITRDSITAPLLSEGIEAAGLRFKRLGVDGGGSTIQVHLDLRSAVDGQTQEINLTVGVRP